MQPIKAIETSYMGYRFRSRLEARWAVFFNKANIEYRYEPEGLEAGNGTRYLPDFYLPRQDVYVEVKGTQESLRADAHKIKAVVADKARRFVILGDVPLVEWGIVLHPLVREDGLYYVRFVGGVDSHLLVDWTNVDEIEMIVGQKLPVGAPVSDLGTEKWGPQAIFGPTRWASKSLMEAYRAARGARFEHGEAAW